MKEPPRGQRRRSPHTFAAWLLLGLVPGFATNLGAAVLNSGNPSTTTIASSTNPARTGNPVTLTATVKDQALHPITTGTVTFTENGAPPAGTVAGDNVVNVDGAGHATFTTSTLTEGDHPILATFNSASFTSSSQSIFQREDNTPTAFVQGETAYSYCNTGAILIPAGSGGPSNIGPASPNPSNVFVTNLPGTIQTVSVALESFFTSSTQIRSISSMLVGPGATNANTLDFFSGTGSATATENGTFTFADGATLVPMAAFSSGTYQPTSYTGADTFSPSASGFFTLPGGPYSYAPTAGTRTLASVYGSKVGSGTWSLYFNQSIHADDSGVTRGWCLNFVVNPPVANAVMGHLGSAPSNHFKQGEQNAKFTLAITNSGPGPTGDPDGNHPLVAVDALPAGFTTGMLPTGSPWNCTVVSSTVTCKHDDAIAAGGSYPLLTIPVNVPGNAGSTVNNSATVSGGGITTINSNTDTVTIDPAPILALTKSHPVPFTQGQIGGWNIQVTNTVTDVTGTTDGSTVTVSDVLPTGFTLQGFTGAGWSCGGTTTVTCTTTAVVPGGMTNFNLLTLNVNVPANSPTSVGNTASVFGGGDLLHTSLATAATGSDTAAVTQVPASITINGSATQSAPVNTAFGNLAVTVRDAANAVIPEYSPVTFTAPAAGASGTFGNGTDTIAGPTNFSGVASPGPFTANGLMGAYVLTVAAGSAPEATFNLTNTTSLDFFTLTPCRIVDTRLPAGPTGGPAIAPGAARTFTIVGACGVSLTAGAVAVNVTVVSPTASGGVRVFPGDLASPPDVDETVPFAAGQTRANNAVLLLDSTGTLTVQNDSAVAVNVIIDVNGDFE